ncbi:sodium:solute symporter [Marinigracilibium pacificum]|uniref:Sodium:solute symporter n=1 Tax=Marinigracilibium pacificum TaxID=2729599 RepID=A0A848J6G9_9BACT|nr:sodium:solute symporter [Marinigracilibium pacificum]NMM48722.1 sodium:solute symporter [Marinigracilibium pacificum]
MNATSVAVIILGYFLVLFVIARFTGKKADTDTFFTAGRQSPWYVVAFGMIGASLSGVTFISVPGWVGASKFTYMSMVIGYLAGYLAIAYILLPLYYRLNLVSIYTYLEKRFGFYSYKTGAGFFLISRIIGASFRLFLVAGVLQLAVFNHWGIPFGVTVTIAIALIWVYTLKGGIKTVVWTDTLQTMFMLLAVSITIIIIGNKMDWGFTEIVGNVKSSSFNKWFEMDVDKPNFWLKNFLAGAFITLTMTGLDQDMMQKNLTCRSLKDAQKNMLWFSVILVVVNLVFLSLGALLFMYSEKNGIPIPKDTDNLYPNLALNSLGPAAGILFMLGIIAAAYSSADSALTALTTSFCYDFLNIKKYPEAKRKKIKLITHIGMSVTLLIVILIFNEIKRDNVIKELFNAAGYTYGPLLGLFAYGLFIRKKLKWEIMVPVVAVISPIVTYLLVLNSEDLFGGYQIGFEKLLINGLFTIVGLLIITDWNSRDEELSAVE